MDQTGITHPFSKEHRTTRIEDPTPSGKTPVPGLLLLLLSISKVTRALMGSRLAQAGFHSGQDELLFALDEEKPVAVHRLAEMLRVRPSTVSKMLDRLREKDLIRRLPDERDARMTRVAITPAGLAVRIGLVNLREDVEQEIAKALRTDADETIRSLTDVSDALNKRFDRQR